MAATIIGNTSVSFGIPTAQTGMVVQSVNSSASSDTAELKNKDGDITAVVFKNKKVTIQVEGAYTSFSGSVGTSLVVNNTNKFGLTGASYITETSRTRSADDFERVSISATIYDGIS